MADRSTSTAPTETAFELDPAAWPTDWRAAWEIMEDGSAPRAWHRSGLCFFFEFEPVDEQGSWAWVVYDDDISQSRLFELHAGMSDEAFYAFSLLLGRQAKRLWHELGHPDFRLGR